MSPLEPLVARLIERFALQLKPSIARNAEFFRCYLIARSYWACYSEELAYGFLHSGTNVSVRDICTAIAADSYVRNPFLAPVNPKGTYLYVAVLLCLAQDARLSHYALHSNRARRAASYHSRISSEVL